MDKETAAKRIFHVAKLEGSDPALRDEYVIALLRQCFLQDISNGGIIIDDEDVYLIHRLWHAERDQ